MILNAGAAGRTVFSWQNNGRGALGFGGCRVNQRLHGALLEAQDPGADPPLIVQDKVLGRPTDGQTASMTAGCRRDCHQSRTAHGVRPLEGPRVVGGNLTESPDHMKIFTVTWFYRL